MTGPRSPRRILLWTAVVAFIIVPVIAGGMECERTATAEADAAARSGGPHGCWVPRPVAVACALIGPGAVYAGTRVFALGVLLTAPVLVAAIALELRERRRSDPKARPRSAPLIVLATGGVAVVAVFGLGLSYHLVDEHNKEKRRACGEEDALVKQAWKAYQPKDLEARRAVSTVHFYVGYYSYDSVCEAARAVPPDAGDPAYAAAMQATERLWENCRGRDGKPFCTRVPRD